MNTKVFLSYRRGDEPGYVGRLADDFESVFGKVVFRDVDKIECGENWKDSLTHAISSSEVMLVIIGPEWEKILIDRKNDPIDFVREELKIAKKMSITILPVLLGETVMPSEESLGDIAWLSGIQKYTIIDEQRRWDSDVSGLIDRIVATTNLTMIVKPTNEFWWKDSKWLIGAVAVPVLVAAFQYFPARVTAKNTQTCNLIVSIKSITPDVSLEGLAVQLRDVYNNKNKETAAISSKGKGVLVLPSGENNKWKLSIKWPSGHVSKFDEFVTCSKLYYGESHEGKLEISVSGS